MPTYKVEYYDLVTHYYNATIDSKRKLTRQEISDIVFFPEDEREGVTVEYEECEKNSLGGEVNSIYLK